MQAINVLAGKQGHGVLWSPLRKTRVRYSTMAGEATQTAGLVERLERQLRDTVAELEQARAECAQRERLALIGQIAVGIGHELRQPLSVINNLAHCIRLLSEKSVPAGSSPALAPYLDGIGEQVLLADRIITSLTDYARTQNPSRRPTDLNALVEQQVRLFDVPANISVEKQLAPGLIPALADPVHIERALHNLAANAIESMRGQGGELRVATFALQGQVVLEVADTGPGIAQELHEKIFQPLFSTRTSGVGLGLALTRHLVEANQGSITFRSAPGHGTAFQVRLAPAV